MVANLTRSDGEDGYVPTEESFVAAPSCNESELTLANSYDKHQLIEYLNQGCSTGGPGAGCGPHLISYVPQRFY